MGCFTMIGTTLAHYEVLEKLGEGGMGVVYKARDTHLDRFVALKVLPADKLADAVRKTRFVQEAKSASALNHPNIVHIYDIAESGGVPFIAMEYVSGRSLDELIGRRLPLGEALKYAVQAADALAKAHAAGIVHRDLKPSNIMVTDDGLVKLLDFGLAKLIEPEIDTEEIEATESLPTREKPLTQKGQIAGTAAYMSPEQAEGFRIDARSDIFSFGAVLYEMVTGRPAFQRGGPMATLAAVLHEEPRSAQDLVAGLPSDVVRAIERCLRKNRERRWQTMSDLRAALQDLQEESQAGALPARPIPIRSWAPWLRMALAVFVALGLMSAFFFFRAKPPSDPPATWTPVPLTTYAGREIGPSFSPDGSQVAFAWDGEAGNYDIYIRLIGPGRPLRLTHDRLPDSDPAWSPDGRFIAFYRRVGPARMALLLIPALGGAERKLVEFDFETQIWASPSWSPDGEWLVISARMAGAERNALYRCTVETGELTPLTDPPPQATHGDDYPAIAPDGRLIAFQRAGVAGFSHLYLLSMSPDGRAAGEPRRIEVPLEIFAAMAWTPDARGLIIASGVTGPQRSARSDLNRISLDGPAKLLPLNLPEAAQPAISLRGNRLVYVEARTDTNIWEADLNGARSARKLIFSSLREVNPKYSPDGTRIAFSSNRSGIYEIWVGDADGENVNQLTHLGAAVSGSPQWSPDGRAIAFDSNLGGSYNIYTVNTDGGKPQRLTNEANNIIPAWAPDGNRIYFGSDRTGRWEIWSMDPAGTTLKQITRNGGYAPLASADGRTIFYAKGLSFALAELFRVGAAGGEEQRVVSGVHRYSFAVTPQGIYYSTSERGGVSVRFFDLKSGKTKELLASEDPVDLGLAVSPDGRRLLFVKIDHFESDLMLVEGFR